MGSPQAIVYKPPGPGMVKEFFEKWDGGKYEAL